MGSYYLHRYANDSELGAKLATYEYKGDGVLEFPTLGISVKKGDQFDGPDGITVAGVSVVSAKSSKPSPIAPKDETVTPDTKEVN